VAWHDFLHSYRTVSANFHTSMTIHCSP